ncbi:hypothetical protein OBBRIDRAFT_729653 [Obba rivulosa]|uniref:Uncharacterized protein n=1 Tax=Obba rivulosa TaxID=1052685 RepID=A0A8E2DNR1_9APHY|nr:hypothetical protein OBBRIDRAFT_729653 [Obba rivulosa]
MPTSFTRKGILDAVGIHVVCGDQALLIGNKPIFINCLIVMHLKTMREDLPKCATIYVYIHNKFTDHMSILKINIAAVLGDISMTWDL